MPNRITQRALGVWRANVDADLGLYVQDRWTRSNLTLNYGLRYDYFSNSYPEQHIGPTTLAPNAEHHVPGAAWAGALHDLSPRLGAVYDLGGTGKTALKASLNRYVLAMGPDVSFIQLANPSRNLVTTRHPDVDRRQPRLHPAVRSAERAERTASAARCRTRTSAPWSPTSPTTRRR